MLTKAKKIDFHTLGKNTRRDVADALVAAGRGHIGASYSLVEILLVLYHGVLKFDAKNPHWDGRDRMILSKGHGCLTLYAILADFGFFPKAELKRFCMPDGLLGGHPEHKVPGVEASTGALGHGPSIGVGMAMAAKLDKKEHGVFVVVGDGECDEGSVWEAAMHAAKHKLDNFTILVDYNKQQSYSEVTEVLPLEPFADKWRAFGFDTHEADMDHPEKLLEILKTPRNGAPRAVLCHTIKGKGISFIERNLKWHHKVKLTPEEIENIYNELEI